MAKNLEFSGFDTVALAQKYGTPLYVLSEDIVRDRISAIKKAFELTDARYDINYAGKALTNIAMCKIIASEGICLDVVSKGEIMTALAAGFPAARMCFHGNNKTTDDLIFAVSSGIGYIVVDSEDELKKLAPVAKHADKPVKIMFRVSPGVEAHTHELIETGTEDSKFGLPYGEAQRVITAASELPNIKVTGLHSHIGSQIVDEKPFAAAADKMLALYARLQDAGVPLEDLNLGGGFGIPYLKTDETFDVIKTIPKMVAHIADLCRTYNIEMPKIIVEPGRYIVAEAGVTLYTIGTVKKIPGIRTYVAVDGGMNDNPRPALYGAEYEAYICNGKETDALEDVRVSGRACENDELIDTVSLNAPTVGDTLMITNTGAYNYSMASNYNRFPRPAMVLLSKGRDALMVARETEEDLMHFDRVPDWLDKA